MIRCFHLLTKSAPYVPIDYLVSYKWLMTPPPPAQLFFPQHQTTEDKMVKNEDFKLYNVRIHCSICGFYLTLA